MEIIAINETSYKIKYADFDCLLYNGKFVGYIVNISNNNISFTINTTSTEVIISDLVAGMDYSITVALVNEVGEGPYSDAISFEAGTCECQIFICSIQIFYYIDIVPGLVDSVYVKTSQTMAIISWDIPDYIPANYSIITYEIGYFLIDTETMCVTTSIKNVATPSHGQMNVTVLMAHVDSLMADSCYAFAVRAYTDIGHGGWSLVAKRTAIHEDLVYGEHQQCKQNKTTVG